MSRFSLPLALAAATLAACTRTAPPAETSQRGTNPDSASPSKHAPARLPPEVIQHVVRGSFPKIRACYEKGLDRNAKLHGKVKVRFTIDESGKVSSAEDYGSTLPDADVITCVLVVYRKLTFPQPDGGKVTVVYPINFDTGVAPGLGAGAATD